jgi:transcriptional regulator with XRE-family HTH domain
MFVVINIKKIRKLLNQSVEEFAIDMEVNTATQRRYEKGIAQPDDLYLKRLEALVARMPKGIMKSDLIHKAPDAVSEVHRLRQENDYLLKKVAEQEKTIKVMRMQIEKAKSLLS